MSNLIAMSKEDDDITRVLNILSVAGFNIGKDHPVVGNMANAVRIYRHIDRVKALEEAAKVCDEREFANLYGIKECAAEIRALKETKND